MTTQTRSLQDAVSQHQGTTGRRPAETAVRSSADHVGVVRGFYAALARGDAAGVLGALHPDVEWTEAERFPYYSGTWRSPGEVAAKLLAPLARDWEGFRATPREFIAQGDRVVALGEYSGVFKATGKAMTSPFAHVWTVRDERMARFDMYTDTAKVLEATRP